jgi:hypothetical protein
VLFKKPLNRLADGRSGQQVRAALKYCHELRCSASNLVRYARPRTILYPRKPKILNRIWMVRLWKGRVLAFCNCSDTMRIQWLLSLSFGHIRCTEANGDSSSSEHSKQIPITISSSAKLRFDISSELLRSADGAECYRSPE